MGIFFKSIFRNSGGSSRTFSKDGSFTHIVQFLNAATVQINTTTDATFTVPNFTTSSKLHTILTASDSANYFGNAATADSPQSVNMNSDFQLNQIGVAANSSGAARADFDTSELMFYTSDQSDNRFKIESNINNYYGLYTFQGDGFVETWYDQSGSGNDATQATAGNQPAIVENGGLVTVNSKPAIKFDGSDNYLIIDSELEFNSSASNKANTILNVASIVSGDRSYMGLGSGTVNWFGVPYLNNYIYRDVASNIINTGETVPLNQQISFTFVSDESNDIETYQNGTSIDSNDSTFTSRLRIKNIGRSYQGTSYNEMSSQEIVFYADDKTSDITDLHNDINNYYGI